MTAELVQLTTPHAPAAAEPQLAVVQAPLPPPAVVIALRPKRRVAAPITRLPRDTAAYRVDGSLALAAQPAYLEQLPEALPAAAPPEVTRAAVIVARALLEVLSGWRPASQLSRWTSYPLQQDLERRAPRRPVGARLQLRRIRVSEPAAGIAEVCATADDPVQRRVRVIALRLEDRRGEWIVTRLQAG